MSWRISLLSWVRVSILSFMFTASCVTTAMSQETAEPKKPSEPKEAKENPTTATAATKTPDDRLERIEKQLSELTKVLQLMKPSVSSRTEATKTPSTPPTVPTASSDGVREGCSIASGCNVAMNARNDNEPFSFHLMGSNSTFADGHVRFIHQGISLTTMADLCTRAAGEVISEDF